jgi:GT2 family glycosyltransferase
MISVVILSYNTMETTLKCLECLHRTKGVEWETYVVDNASSDGTTDEIRARFPNVNLIVNKDNVGFAKGNNQAMAKARGDWILLLNSDAFVFENTLSKLANWITLNPEADLVGCQLLNRDGTLQQSWGFFPNLRRILFSMLFIDNLPIIRDVIDPIHVRSDVRYLTDVSVDWVTGAFVALKREVWEKVGGIDENFFMYGEEIEWMFRIKQSGYKIWYTPLAKCVHLLGASSNNREVAVVGEMKGWKYWFSKHNKPWEQKLLPYLITLGCKLRIWLKPSTREYYIKALSEV